MRPRHRRCRGRDGERIAAVVRWRHDRRRFLVPSKGGATPRVRRSAERRWGENRPETGGRSPFARDPTLPFRTAQDAVRPARPRAAPMAGRRCGSRGLYVALFASAHAVVGADRRAHTGPTGGHRAPKRLAPHTTPASAPNCVYWPGSCSVTRWPTCTAAHGEDGAASCANTASPCRSQRV